MSRDKFLQMDGAKGEQKDKAADLSEASDHTHLAVVAARTRSTFCFFNQLTSNWVATWIPLATVIE
jgi:hypothetical protein